MIPSVKEAIAKLKTLQKELERRMDTLRDRGLNNFEDLKDHLNDDNLKRHLVVVDEAAEIFLGGHHAAISELTTARKIISQIARQGRSVGVHLVMATQRPDAKAIDPQVKTNLTGIVCFQMPNNVSSITVLDSGRATSLPDIQGRAIWKFGGKLLEVQVSHLKVKAAENMLMPYREKKRDRASEKSLPKKDLTSFDMEV